MALDLHNEMEAQDQNMHPEIHNKLAEGLRLATNFIRELQSLNKSWLQQAIKIMGVRPITKVVHIYSLGSKKGEQIVLQLSFTLRLSWSSWVIQEFILFEYI